MYSFFFGTKKQEIEDEVEDEEVEVEQDEAKDDNDAVDSSKVTPPSQPLSSGENDLQDDEIFLSGNDKSFGSICNLLSQPSSIELDQMKAIRSALDDEDVVKEVGTTESKSDEDKNFTSDAETEKTRTNDKALDSSSFERPASEEAQEQPILPLKHDGEDHSRSNDSDESLGAADPVVVNDDCLKYENVKESGDVSQEFTQQEETLDNSETSDAQVDNGRADEDGVTEHLQVKNFSAANFSHQKNITKKEVITEDTQGAQGTVKAMKSPENQNARFDIYDLLEDEKEASNLDIISPGKLSSSSAEYDLEESTENKEKEVFPEDNGGNAKEGRRWSFLGFTAGEGLDRRNNEKSETESSSSKFDEEKPKMSLLDTIEKLEAKKNLEIESPTPACAKALEDGNDEVPDAEKIYKSAPPNDSFLVNDDLLAKTLSIYEEISKEDELLLESFRASEQPTEQEEYDDNATLVPAEAAPSSLALLKKSRQHTPREISQESQSLFDILHRDFASVTPRVTVKLAGMSQQLTAEDVKLCFVAFVSCFSPPLKSHFATEFNYTENDFGSRRGRSRASDDDRSVGSGTSRSSNFDGEDEPDSERFPRPYVPSKLVNALWMDVIRCRFLERDDITQGVARQIDAARGDLFLPALSFIRDTLVLLGVLDVRKMYSRSSLRGTEEKLSMEETYFVDASRGMRETVEEVITIHQDIHQEYGEYLIQSNGKEKFHDTIKKYEKRWNGVIVDNCTLDTQNETEASYVVQMLPWNTIRANRFREAAALLAEKKFLNGRLQSLGILEGTTAQVTDAEELVLRYFDKKNAILCFESIDPDQMMLNAYERTRKDITREVEELDSADDANHSGGADKAFRQRLKRMYVATGKALHLLGVSLGAQGFLDEELDFCKHALRLKRSAAFGPTVTIADTLHCAGFSLDNSGQYLEAMEFYNQALTIRRSLLGDHDIRVAETLHNKGAILCENGETDDALACLEEALNIRVNHFGEHHESCADTQQWIGNVMREYGDCDTALLFFQTALSTKKVILGADHDEVANTLQNMAVVLDDMAKYQLSLDCYQEALRIYILQFGREHIRVADTLQRIAIDYAILEEDEKSLEFFNQSIELREKLLDEEIYGLNDPKWMVRSLIYPDEVDIDEVLGRFQDLIECYDEARQLTLRLKPEDYEPLSKIHHRLGDLYFEAQDFDGSIEAVEEALKCQRVLADKLTVNEEEVCTLLYKKGVVHLCKQEYQKAKPCFESVIYRRRNGKANNLGAEATALYCLGVTFDSLGAHKLALSAFTEALNAWKEDGGENDVRCGYSLYWLGKQEFDSKRYEEAVVWYRGALGTFKANKTDVDYTIVAKTLELLGGTHEHLEDMDSALRCYNEGIRLVRWKLGEHHEFAIDMLCRSGHIKRKLGESEDAMELYENAIFAMKKSSRPEGIELCDTIHVLGLLCQEQGDIKRAKDLLSESYRLYESVLGQDDLRSAAAVLTLGRVLDLQGSHEAAMQCYREALRVQQSKLNPDHEDAAETLFCMGANMMLSHRYENAIKCFQQALSIQRRAYGDNHLLVSRTLNHLAKSYNAVRSLDKAVVCYKEALRIITTNDNTNKEEIAEMSFEMAEAHEANDNYQAAIAKYRDCLDVWRDSEEHNIRLPLLLQKLGLVHLKGGDNEDAIDCLGEALQLMEAADQDTYGLEILSSTIVGLAKSFSNVASYDSAIVYYQRQVDLLKDDPEKGEAVSDSLYSMGTIYARVNNLDDAILHFKECLLVRKKTFGGTDERVARVLANMGVVFEKLEDFVAAKDCFSEAIRIYKVNANEREASSLLQDLGRSLTKQGNLDAALESYSEALLVIKKIAGSNDPQVASLHYVCGTTLFDKGDFEKALTSFRQCEKIRRTKTGSESRETAETVCMVGQTLEKLGEYDEAIESLKDALGALLLIKGEESLDVGNCHQALGLAYAAKGEHKEAVAQLLDAIAPRQRFFGEDSVDMAATYFELASCYSSLDEWDAALTYSVKALRIRKVVSGAENLEFAESLSQLGDIQLSLFKHMEALNCYVEALKVFSAVEGRGHLTVAECLEKIGSIYLGQDQYTEAVENLKRAMKLYTENLGGLTSQVASVLRMLGQVEVKRLSYESAVNYFKQSLQISKELNDDPKIAASLFEIGKILQMKGSRGEAMECYKETLRLAVSSEGAITRAKTFNRIGGLLADMEDFEDAMKACEKSLSLFKKLNIESAVEIGETYQIIATIYEGQGEYNKSLEFFEKAHKILLEKEGPNDLSVALVLNNLAINQARRRNFEEAFEFCNQSLKIRRDKLGTDHVDTCDTLYNIANIVDEWGKVDDAMKYYTEALEAYRSIMGSEDLEIANCYQYIGILHVKKGEEEEAMRAFVEALRIFQIHKEESLGMGLILFNLGKIYNKQKEYEKGIETLAHSLRIQKAMGSDTTDRAPTCDQIGVAYAGKGMKMEAKKFFQRALNLFADSGKQDTVEYAHVLAHHADVLSIEETFDEALKLFHDALEIFKRDIGEESNEVAEILVKIGIIHNQRVDYEEALRLLSAALNIRSKLFGRDDMRVAETLFEIAKVMEEWSDSEEALDTYAEVIRIVKIHHGQRHIMFAEGLKRIGSIHAEKGNHSDAIQCLDQSILLQRRLLGEDSVEIGHTLLSLAGVHDGQDQEDDALAAYTDALQIFRKNLGDEDVFCALALNNIGINHARRKNYEKAIALCNEAYRIRKVRLGEDHLDVADSCLNIANVLDEWGKDEQAMGYYKEALGLYKAQLGDDDIEVANCLSAVGGIHVKLNDHRRAISCFVETIRIYRLKKGMDNLEVAQALFHLGRVYGKTADYEKALTCFTECLRIREAKLGSSHAEVLAVHRYIEAIHRKRRR